MQSYFRWRHYKPLIIKFTCKTKYLQLFLPADRFYWLLIFAEVGLKGGGVNNNPGMGVQKLLKFADLSYRRPLKKQLKQNHPIHQTMILQSKLPIFNFVLQRKIAEENKARNNNVFCFIDWSTLEFSIMKWKLKKSRIFQFVTIRDDV